MNFKSILAVVVVALSFVVVGCTDNSQYVPKNKTKVVDRSDRVIEFFEDDDDEFLDIDLYKKPKKTYYQKERRFQQKPKKKSYFRTKKKRKWRY